MRKERNRDKTVKKIIDSAIELFEKKGFLKTSTLAIAKKTGVAHGTIFYYFPKRYDLIIAAIYEAMSDLSFDLLRKAKDHSSIEEICEIFIDETLKHIDLYSNLVRELPLLPLDIQKIVFASLSGFSTHFIEIIKLKKKKSNGEIDTKFFVFFWFGMINYIYSYKELLGAEEIFKNHKKELIQIFVSSLSSF